MNFQIVELFFLTLLAFLYELDSLKQVIDAKLVIFVALFLYNIIHFFCHLFNLKIMKHSKVGVLQTNFGVFHQEGMPSILDNLLDEALQSWIGALHQERLKKVVFSSSQICLNFTSKFNSIFNLFLFYSRKSYFQWIKNILKKGV